MLNALDFFHSFLAVLLAQILQNTLAENCFSFILYAFTTLFLFRDSVLKKKSRVETLRRNHFELFVESKTIPWFLKGTHINPDLICTFWCSIKKFFLHHLRNNFHCKSFFTVRSLLVEIKGILCIRFFLSCVTVL